MPECLVADLGSIDYRAALALQRDLHHRVASGDLPAILLLLQHPHVYTLGRRGTESDLLVSEDSLRELNADVCHTDRGGEVTYHGPGQLVAYPILNLRDAGLGPLHYVRALERIIISTLADIGIHASSEDRPTGVWVGDSKIAAIGVRVSRGVTMHGFALNVNPDLSYFNHIVPCGMPEASVTSIAEQGVDLDVPAISEIVTTHFAGILDYSVMYTTLSALMEETLPVMPTALGRP